MEKKYIPSALILYLNYFIHGIGCSILSQQVVKEELVSQWGLSDVMTVTSVAAALGLGRLISLPFAGPVSDKLGRKLSVLIGVASYVIFFAGITFSPNMQFAYVAAVLGGIANSFLELHPTKYAEELVKRMEESGAKAYLVNTGWNGTGKRISIKDTRGIIDAILNGDILKAPTKKIPYFNIEVPTELPGVDANILDPRDTYEDASQWEEKAKDLAGRFIKNFKKYEGNEAGKALVPAGPQV